MAPSAVSPEPQELSVDLFPNGGWDTHHHIFEPALFPYDADRHLTPPPATVQQFQAFKKRLGFTNSILAHGMSYGADCSSLKAFVPRLGGVSGGAGAGGSTTTTRAIGIIDPRATGDAELLSMHKAGVRGLRVNLYRQPGAMTDAALQRAALAEHVERLVRLSLANTWSLTLTTVRPGLWEDLAPFVESVVAPAGVRLVTDHFALLKAPSMLPAPTGREAADDDDDDDHHHHWASSTIRQPGLQAVLRLVASGLLWVKLSAPYRVSELGPGYEDLEPLVRALVGANPRRVLWGSDWPHTPRMRAGPRTEGDRLAETPFLEVDDAAWLRRLRSWLSEDEWHLLMVENPRELFGRD